MSKQIGTLKLVVTMPAYEEDLAHKNDLPSGLHWDWLEYREPGVTAFDGADSPKRRHIEIESVTLIEDEDV